MSGFVSELKSLVGRFKSQGDVGKVEPRTKSAGLKSKGGNRGKSKARKCSTGSQQSAGDSVDIKSRVEIPSYFKCLSVRELHGESEDCILLGDKNREKYVVLKKTKEGNRVYIISAQSTATNSLDPDYLNIYERCIAKGFEVTKLYARDSIIGIIYEIEENKREKKDHAAEFKAAKGLQREFDAILIDSARNGVSDLHFEVRRNTAVIRQRIDGQLVEKEQLPVQKARKMASVIYQVMAEEQDPTFNEAIPQDGVIDREVDGLRIRVRLATIPAYPDGFDMIMRILTIGVETSSLTFEEAGYAPEQIQLINDALSQPKGATILAGVTGSGKTTSLSIMLDGQVKRYGGRIKVISIEDPPEKIVNGVTHVPVASNKKDPLGTNPFAAAIKASLRSDPDMLNIGEVRDEDSAELLVRATQSGHQASSTTHAPSAVSIVARFRGFGVPNDILGSPDFFSCLIYQTLVPLVCQDCCISMSEVLASQELAIKYERVIERLNKCFSGDPEILGKIKFKNLNGCPKCKSGGKGRKVAAEVIVPDETMYDLFAQGQDNAALRHYYQNLSGRSVLQYGIDMIEDGIACPLDVEHKCGLLTKEKRYYYKKFDFNEVKLTQEAKPEFEDNLSDYIQTPLDGNELGAVGENIVSLHDSNDSND